MSDQPKIRAIVIKPDGDCYFEMMTVPTSLELQQGIVGGYIESLPVPSPTNLDPDAEEVATMIINEEGKFNGSPANPVATALMKSWLMKEDFIAGTVIVYGPIDGRGEPTDTPRHVEHRIYDLVSAVRGRVGYVKT